MASGKYIEEEFKGSVSSLVARVRGGDSAVKCRSVLLDGSHIGDAEALQLCGVLHHFTALERLFPCARNISHVGVSALCRVLPLCERLTYLNLSHHSIDNAAAKLIANVLNATTLEKLHLFNNGIGRNGIRSLLLAAANSETLKELDINRNTGVELAAADIEEILPHCRTLHLWLGWGDELSDEFRQRIRTVLQRCSESLRVYFGYEDGATGAKDFGVSLLDSTTDSAVFHREFLSALHLHGSIRVHRCRVSFVGDSRVGKTWTAKSLRGEVNVPPETVEECNGLRTAAAESTALYIGDLTVSDATRSDHPGGSEGASEVISASDNRQSSARDLRGALAVNDDTIPVPKRRRVETSKLDTFKIHDKVHSVRFPESVLNSTNVDPDNTVCYLTLWDFGGQLMYHSWYQFFFSPGMIPCVIFDLSKVVGDSRDPHSADVRDAVQRIVHYAQQSLRFGGANCRVLLVGTHVDSVVLDGDDGRADIASTAFDMIVEASPDHLAERYHEFASVDPRLAVQSVVDGDNDCDTVPGVCAVDNNASRIDPGVVCLQHSLIRECLRIGDHESEDDSDLLVTENVSKAPEITAKRARKLLCHNIVPLHWYEFELHIREDVQWQLRDLCRVSQLWGFSQTLEHPPSSRSEFAAMLSAMAAAGTVILADEIDLEIELENEAREQAAFERWMNSIVIVRPQWLIEVGQRLLPRPHEPQKAYVARLRQELKGLAQVAKFSKALYETATVDYRLLRRILTQCNDVSKDVFDDIVRFFESRLILCRIESAAAASETERQWFAPSMVVFHAEHESSMSRELKPMEASDVRMAVKFEWLPPGLPLLVVGSMLQGVRVRPTFSVCVETGRIQFKVAYSGSPQEVFIDLTHGAGGNELIVWTERPLDNNWQPVVQHLLKKLLQSVATACSRLCVEACLEEPFCSQERSLIVDVEVPVMPKSSENGGDLELLTLRDFCVGSHRPLVDRCDVDATKRMYHSVLSEVDCANVPPEWLMGLATPVE